MVNKSEENEQAGPAAAGAAPEAQAAQEATSEPTTVEELRAALARAREQLAQKEAEAAEYLDNWRRAAADLSNARKRMLREQEDMRALANERLLEKLLPIVDDVERAIAALPPDQANSDWANGFRAIQRKMQGLLESEGVTSIETAGKTFDPELHYAITHEEAEGYEEGQIISETARGYKLHDRVLRPSMVRVAKGNTKNN